MLSPVDLYISRINLILTCQHLYHHLFSLLNLRIQNPKSLKIAWIYIPILWYTNHCAPPKNWQPLKFCNYATWTSFNSKLHCYIFSKFLCVISKVLLKIFIHVFCCWLLELWIIWFAGNHYINIFLSKGKRILCIETKTKRTVVFISCQTNITFYLYVIASTSTIPIQYFWNLFLFSLLLSDFFSTGVETSFTAHSHLNCFYLLGDKKAVSLLNSIETFECKIIRYTKIPDLPHLICIYDFG